MSFMVVTVKEYKLKIKELNIMSLFTETLVKIIYKNRKLTEPFIPEDLRKGIKTLLN